MKMKMKYKLLIGIMTLNASSSFADLSLTSSQIINMKAVDVINTNNLVVDGVSFGSYNGTVGSVRATFKSIILSNDTNQINNLLTSIGHPELISKVADLRASVIAGTHSDTKALLSEILSTPGILNVVEQQSKTMPVGGFDESFVSPAIMSSVFNVTKVIGTRISPSGVSSGDQSQNDRGAWVSADLGRAVQKDTTKFSGYKSSVKGFSIGGDTDVSESTMIGAAYSLINSNLSPKASNVQKVKSTSHLLSIYGGHSIDSGVNFTGQVHCGFGKLRKYYSTVKAKANSLVYGGNVTTGYSIAFGSYTTFTPSLGLAHEYFYTKGYTLANALGNSNVSSSRASRSSALIGVRLDNLLSLDKSDINTDLHAILDTSFKNKIKHPSITLFNVKNTSNAEKMHKNIYYLGGSITTSIDSVDLGLGYDLSLAKKYTGHNGYIKARINL